MPFCVLLGRSYEMPCQMRDDFGRGITHCRVDVWYNTTLRDDDVTEELVQPDER